MSGQDSAHAVPGNQVQRRPDGTFPPGVSGNPSGKPKGSFSVRAAWKRKLAKGFETDTEAGEGEERLGTLARALADQLQMAIERGDSDAVRALCLAIAEAEGKPQERVEHSGDVTMRRVILDEGGV